MNNEQINDSFTVNFVAVDMFERRFVSELNKLPRFAPGGKRDNRVWRVGFPAWHALWSSLCLYGHSTGYRLPSFENFYQYCKKAYTHGKYKQEGQFAKYFTGDFEAGMRQRVSVWYEAGMAEMYLYVCLVEAVEDKDKVGVVMYDTRADWKLKADAIVLINGKSIRVSAFFGEADKRGEVEKRREQVELVRKKNTMQSAHWGNKALNAMPVYEIARTEKNTQYVNGLRFFDKASINTLINQIYAEAGLESAYQFPCPARAA